MSQTAPRSRESSATLPILKGKRERTRTSLRTSQLAYGQPWVWVFGGALVICLVMIVGLLYLIVRFGLPTFWPGPMVAMTTYEGNRVMGENVREDRYRPAENHFDRLPTAVRDAARTYVTGNKGFADRHLIKTGNFELTQSH